MNGVHQIRQGASPQIGSSDTPKEQRVARKKYLPTVCEVKGQASGCVAGSVQDIQFDSAALYDITMRQKPVDGTGIRVRHTQPVGLGVKILEEEEIALMNGCQRTGCSLQISDGADVIDVRMSRDHRVEGKVQSAQPIENLCGVVSGINDKSVP